MNQILSVDLSEKSRKNKKLSIRAVVIFFCIILILFGSATATIGIYLNINQENNKPVEVVVENTDKPRIDVVKSPYKLTITATSDDNIISSISYKWDDEEETPINGNNQNRLSCEIEIKEGTHKLTITATDDKKQRETLVEQFTGVPKYAPTINLSQDIKLAPDDNKIKIDCESKTIIKEIICYFDNDDEIKEEINQEKGSIFIESKQGPHILTVKVIDENEREYTEEKKIYIPILSITDSEDGESFIIKASDQRGIDKVVIDMNGVRNEENNINSSSYEKSLKLNNGKNLLVVSITNSDGLSTTEGKLKRDN